MLSHLGRFDEALELLDSISANLQPPLSLYLNFRYTAIYRLAGNRDEFRRRAQASRASREQLPELYDAIIALEQAQLDVWDENFEAAIENIEAARQVLDQSILQTLIESLGVSELHVNIARLYLEAGALDKASEQLEAVQRVYPSYQYAKLILARVLIASGDADGARLLLQEAIDLWSEADDDYGYLRQAREELAALEG